MGLVYRNQKTRKQRRLSLGRYPITSVAEAKEKARKALAEVQQGLDPAEMKQSARDADTFETLVQRYLTENAKVHCRASTVRKYEGTLRKHLLPAWHGRKACDIHKRDVLALVDGIAYKGGHPIQANRTLNLISAIYRFAVAKDIVDVNPAYGVPQPGKETPRERYLNDDELIAVWRALKTSSPIVADVIRLLILTGARRNEVTELRWSELDLEHAVWELPAERSKSKRELRLPLVGEALAILRRRKQSAGDSRVVFPGRESGKPFTNFFEPLKRIVTTTGVAHFTLHALRRTARTNWAALQVPEHVAERLLNHSVGGELTKVYNKYEYANEKRAALLAWDRHLQRLFSGEAEPSKVVSLR